MKEHPLVEEIELITTGFAWWNHKPHREQLSDRLKSFEKQIRKEERERIEQVFKEEVPPHGLELGDAVWLRRVLQKAFK